MRSQNYHPAPLDPSGLSAVRDLEVKLGKVLVALEPDTRVADLCEEELNQLQQAERELGCVLVCYEGADDG